MIRELLMKGISFVVFLAMSFDSNPIAKAGGGSRGNADFEKYHNCRFRRVEGKI